MELLGRFFSSDAFAPHGYCLMWRPDVFWLHVASDAVIALAYFSIPAALAVFVLKRRNVGGRWLIWMFGAFVFACGVTHLFGIWTMWFPHYGAAGLMKGFTAIISIATACVLWPLIPKALKMRTVEELEQEVFDRTAALRAANESLEREIAHRVETERRLTEARRAAEAANEAKSSFLSVMSHELRTPLNSVLGYSQLMTLDKDNRLHPEHREFVGNIERGGRHLLNLIEDILDFTRIDAGRMSITDETVDVRAVIQAAADETRSAAAAKDIAIRIDAGTPLFALADPVRLQQVLSNLFGNAVKYNNTGGSIEVAADVDNAGKARITIADDGWGVPNARRDELFQPFARLGRENSAAEGTGIGLALVKRLTDAMGGKIEYEPNPPGGSRFVLTLQRAAVAEHKIPAKTPDRQPLSTQKFAAHGFSVLCVEDNPANLDLMRRVLQGRSDGIRFISAQNGAEALSVMRRERPGLILLDLGLPDMDGLELLEHMRDAWGRDLPRVVAVTADATATTRQRTYELGIRDFISKPFDINAIRRIVDGAASAWAAATPQMQHEF